MQTPMIFLTLLAVLSVASNIFAGDWLTLFNGKDLTGWRANVLPDSFKVVDGVMHLQAEKESAHLFYVGNLKEGFVRFKNFELEVTARSEPESNSGIFFHTDMSVQNAKNHLAKGYEVQLNSSQRDKRKTGSLYDVVDLSKSPVDETKWFRVRIRVQNKHIVIHLDDQQVVDYTEPDNVKRPRARAGRLLDPNGGAIAIQAHDPQSIFYFKSIQIRRLD